MTNQLYHAGTSTTVQFSCPPLRGNGDQIARHQVCAHDSGGAPYVYSKNQTLRTVRKLVYPHQSAVILAALLAFMQSRNGDKHNFTWYDHDAVSHTVQFESGNILYKETSPGRFRVELSLIEVL